MSLKYYQRRPFTDQSPIAKATKSPLARDIDPVRLSPPDLGTGGREGSDPGVGVEATGLVAVGSTKLWVFWRGGEFEIVPGPEFVSCDNPIRERFLSAASNDSSQPFIVSMAVSWTLAILACFVLSRIVRSEQWNPSVR